MEIASDITVYPIAGTRPAHLEGRHFFLHAAVQWQDGAKQQLGMVTHEAVVGTDIPVARYVGLTGSRTSMQQDGVRVLPQAELTEHDLTLLRGVTDNIGLVWAYGQRPDRSAKFMVESTFFKCSFEQDGVQLDFRVSSAHFVLGCVRALAMHNLQKRIAAQN